MKDFLFEFDFFIHTICFRYTIIQFEEGGQIKYAAGVAIVFEDESFQMLHGNVFNGLNEAKTYIQELYCSCHDLEPQFFTNLIVL